MLGASGEPRHEHALSAGSDPVGAAERAPALAGEGHRRGASVSAAQQNLIVPPLSDLANLGYPFTPAASSVRPAVRRPRKHTVPSQPDLTATAPAAVSYAPARSNAPQPEIATAPVGADPVRAAGTDASPDDVSKVVDLPDAVLPAASEDLPGPRKSGAPDGDADPPKPAEEGGSVVDKCETAAVDAGREQVNPSSKPSASSSEGIFEYGPSYTTVDSADAIVLPPRPKADVAERTSPVHPVPPAALIYSKPAHSPQAAASDSSLYTASENSLQAPPELPVHEHPTGYSFTYTYVAAISTDSAESAPLVPEPEPDHGVDFDDQGVIDESTLAKIEAMNSMLLSDSKAAKMGIDEFWSRVVSGSAGKDDRNELGKRVRAGIPSSYVGAVWKDLAEIRKSMAPDHISLLAGNELYYEGTIDRHLHIIHQSGQSLANPAGLFRVLKAYGIHDRRLGYCPNAAYVVNSFMKHMSEEDAYHMFVMVMKGTGQFRLRDWSTGAGLQVVLFQLDKVMEACLPDVRKHLLGKGVTADLYAIDWVTSLFQRQAPTTLATRLLSCYLLEGPTFFFKAAIAALSAVRGDLMRANTAEEFLGILQNPFVHDQCGDHDAFLHAAHAVGGISDRVLEQFAVEFEVRRWSRLENLRKLRMQEAEREAAKRAAQDAEREAAKRAAQEVEREAAKRALQDAEREAAKRAANDKAIEAEKTGNRAAPEQKHRSMIIPSGLYSLFSRASRRRSEANVDQPTMEPNSKSRRSIDNEYFPADNGKAPTDLTSQTLSNATTHMSTSSRLSVASAQSGASTPTSFFTQSPANAEPAPADIRAASLPTPGKRSDEMESALLTAYATKTAELATELADAQVAVVRERAAAKALLKQVGELIQTNVRLEVELEQTKKKAEWSEAVRRKLELKLQRMISLVSED